MCQPTASTRSSPGWRAAGCPTCTRWPSRTSATARQAPGGKIDRVLVDAPCSGLGTLRRNPDLKWRQSPQALEELVAKQTAILRAPPACPSRVGAWSPPAACCRRKTRPLPKPSPGHRDFEPLDAGELLAQLKVPEAASLCSGGESGQPLRAPVAAPPPDRRLLCCRLAA